jgi:hypothetical protein
LIGTIGIGVTLTRDAEFLRPAEEVIVYPEFPESNAAPQVDTLALDWVETTGDYPLVCM